MFEASNTVNNNFFVSSSNFQADRIRNIKVRNCNCSADNNFTLVHSKT